MRDAAANRSYWLLTGGFFVCGYHVAFIQIHLPPYIVDRGVDAAIGAWAIGLVGLFNVVGSYASGLLGGCYPKQKLLSFIYLARAIVIAVYILLPITAASTLVFAAVMGLLWLSTVPLTSGLVAAMFGPRYMATLFGIVFLEPPDGRAARRLARRAGLRRDRLLHPRLVGCHRPRPRRRPHALADRGTPGGAA